MDYHFKIWLEENGKPVFGDGLYYLLTKVREYGSINKAAGSLRMSYRQAWGNIKKAEDRLGVKLLIKHIGGESGGGAQLTPEAEELLARFGQFKEEANDLVKKSFQRFFP